MNHTIEIPSTREIKHPALFCSSLTSPSVLPSLLWQAALRPRSFEVEVRVERCLTVQVCVERCPTSSASPWAEARLPLPLPGLKEEMRKFCSQDLTDELFGDLSIAQLVERGYCPPW